MANDSINHIVPLRQLVKKSKKLRDSLEKASALLKIGLENDNFLTRPQIDIYYYLSGIGDILERANNLSHQNFLALQALKSKD